ncbi:nucleoside hydrolase [Planosporangium flavigriseum]|uniref:Purine nucleosidase n=1 Tax=Planosporangium flavigriseum TaxID=373681 RepID=A0A8J3LML6_9ACTN|nr:nucleoside hydrolase [Planosporangium flavigriseum]GIG75953.1 purine nucleosidase [Planosporangium flavigriseum]
MAVSNRLVIDTDPGIDDALTLALAVVSPEVDLQLVTTVAGNSPLEVTTRNALALLDLFGRPDIPVAAGANRALVRIAVHNLPLPHGLNGLGGVEIPDACRTAQPEHAVERLAALLRDAEPRSVTIAAIGPLTNVALLVALYPELTDRIDRLVVMGGSHGPGNITPVAEFNTWTDPEAAQRVLADSGLDITLVGLEVTRRATIDEADLATLRRTSARGAQLADMVNGYSDHGPDGWRMHDVLALAAVIDPTLIQTLDARIEVDTRLGPGRGQTLTFFDALGPYATDGGGVADDRPRVQVAVDLDVPRFRKLVMDRVPQAILA